MPDALYTNHEVIVDNEFATLVYYPDQKLIHHTFHKPLVGEPLRQMLSAGAEALEKNHAIKWLSDDRRNSVLPADDADWARTVWSPRVMEAGWKYWALVVPEELIARFTMTRAVDSGFEQGLRIQAFSKLEEAKQWLEQF